MPKPRITVVGPGRLGTALARALHDSGYPIAAIVHRPGSSAAQARALARDLKSRAVTALNPSGVVFLCAGDSQLPDLVADITNADWRGVIALHTSGALTSDVLAPLRHRGAAVGSMHPMMSFVRGAQTPLWGVWFGIEGQPKAVRAARSIVRNLGGEAMAVKKSAKPLYHAFGAFASPLLVATLTLGERVGRRAGLSEREARSAMKPIVEQTLRNYLQSGAEGAFSGPLVRGDVDTIRKHLAALRAFPDARAAYIALARSACLTLPVKNRNAIRKLLSEPKKKKSAADER
ncbi:MAG: Rossmann-like and DUF2520 domain-containing protein [Terriglobales bacterium]